MAQPVPNRDRFLDVPEPVIHHIMSFLPPKDVTCISVLSKTWLRLRNSFPIIDISQATFYRALPDALSFNEKRELFSDYLLNTIQRPERRTNIHKFKLQVNLVGLSELDQEVYHRAIELVVERNVERMELDFFHIKDKFFDLPTCVYSAKLVTSLKLNRCKVKVEELLLGCPLIEELALKDAKGLEQAKISSPKLEKLELEGCSGLQSVDVVACNLQSFRYKGYLIGPDQIKPQKINLNACISLRNLSLEQATVSDQWLEHHIYRFVHLENLSLEGCVKLTRARICHKKLKTLRLIGCGGVEEVEIDCPRLRGFVFNGKITHFGLLNTSGILDATLNLSRDEANEWFVELRRILGLFDHSKTLKLIFASHKDLIFPEEVKDDFLPPLHDLKNLKIECHSSIADYAELLDNLLWLSPHMETLNLLRLLPHLETFSRASDLEESNFKFQYNKIPGENYDYFCVCQEYPKKCWQHCLQKVVIHNFDSSAHQDHKKSLLKYFCMNAKALNSIQDDSGTFRVADGKYFE
ncbi:putative F-box/LRR-repeat protein At5g38386 [Actinidia eriantha]|uniref:putative F-box/LRR-repeat protein At5g38386 n=1 Tax=Actinidia eriantha TaxID=165200 RepID=UPI00258DC4F8|nr:putative F-box/LRR-repeat protein At5g38386 [Actinidia eriantha]